MQPHRRRQRPAQRNHPHQAGFSLVELVVVITLLGVLAGLAATLVGRVAGGQQATRARLNLALSSDAALAQVADLLATALPNSLRLSSNAEGTWLEWVPVLDAARYRAAPDTIAPAPGDPLDLDDPADASFDLLGTPLAGNPTGSQIVFNNLGTPEADAYSGNNRRSPWTLAASGLHVGFTPAGALPPAAATQRVFVVGTPQTLACLALGGGRHELRLYSGYGWRASQPVAVADLASASSSRLLLGGLHHCGASYSTALANIGLLNLALGLQDADSGAQARFLQQLAVDNTP
jgi:prepilin-type N-terminal cleavage/methylation domain-containing protein